MRVFQVKIIAQSQIQHTVRAEADCAAQVIRLQLRQAHDDEFVGGYGGAVNYRETGQPAFHSGGDFPGWRVIIDVEEGELVKIGIQGCADHPALAERINLVGQVKYRARFSAAVAVIIRLDGTGQLHHCQPSCRPGEQFYRLDKFAAAKGRGQVRCGPH